jgi:hypothetical protein
MQVWRKLGRVYEPNGDKTHASVPFVAEIHDDKATIMFSSRDEHQASSIFSLRLDLNTLDISDCRSDPVLRPGGLGAFDDSGVMGCCILKDQWEYKLYYIGWNLGLTVPFRNSIGLAVSEDNHNYQRKFLGPILDRTKSEPHFCASNCVLKEGDIYKIWYLSCTEWIHMPGANPKHKYHIKYAESEDGIDWRREGIVAIDYRDEFEYAISVPRVLKDHEGYKMWFSSRGSDAEETYRVRYAESRDGITWQRKDSDVLLPVSNSKSDWDSEMICYPFVFDYKEKRYMLYNGNGYGATGFGLAILEEKS